jgi:hypothetical protein
MILNIDTDAVVKHTLRLERLNRSALPVAIRGALNNAAFDVKKNTMPTQAEDDFVNRTKTFFKATSRVDMARGFDIRTMKATVGFMSSGLKGNNNYAVKDLEQQEHGGDIGGKKFIPMTTARAGNNKNRLVSPRNRLGNINKIFNASKAPGKTAAVKFIKTVVFAGRGAYVLAQHKGKRILWRVNSLRRQNGKWKFKLTPLYVENPSKQVEVTQTGFMQKASTKSAKKMDRFFIEQAEKQLNKLR